MEWVVDLAVGWWKFWNAMKLLALILIPIVFGLGMWVWQVVHPASADRFGEWFMKASASWLKKG